MRYLGAWAAAIATTLFMLTISGAARADFSADAIAIIRQVIEDNVATQVVPNGAAELPSTCDLIPASVYALQTRRFDGFASIVREEAAATTGLVAFIVTDRGASAKLVLQSAGLTNPPIAQVSFPLRPQTVKLLGRLAGDPNWAAGSSINGANKCVFDSHVSAASVPPPGVAPRQSVPMSVLSACAATQSLPHQELSCAIGIAVRDAANGETSKIAADGERAAVTIAAIALMELVPGLSFSDALSDVNQLLSNTPSPIVPLSGPALLPAVEQKIRSLLGQVAALSMGGEMSIERVLGIVAVFGTSASTMAGRPLASDQQIAALRDLLRGSYVVYEDVQAKNYAAAAGDVFETLDDVVKDECGTRTAGACSNRNRLVRVFLRAAATYTIDSLMTGNGDDASADFRAAAVDLIEDAGGAGIRRKTFSSDSGQYPGWYFPNFTLRGALRPGFAGRTDPGTNSSNFTTYASVDWPNLRYKIYPASRVTNPLWVGGNFSLIDAIGPLFEAAARNPTLGRQRTRAGQAFALGFVVPRVEFEFGVPELTRNLVVGAGGTMRLYRAVEAPVTTASLPTIADYCFAFQSHCPGGAFNANDFEASLFVKYVP